MTEQGDTARGRALVQRLAYPLRRAVAPAALELQGRVEELSAETTTLREEVAALRARVEELTAGLAEIREDARSRAEHVDARFSAAEVREGELTDGLEEARRLNLRVAELVDLVTELVLPLHDREIDPAVLGRLRPDTL
jgi:predicted nuclease with TOPRIM domain